MNDAQKHVRDALEDLREVIRRLDEAAGCVRAQGLRDFDARALALARTNAEQAEMWARRALAQLPEER